MSSSYRSRWSTPGDCVSICISIIATQHQAFISSSHYHNNLQGIQQFPLSALLKISLRQALDYSPASSATTTTSISTTLKQTVRKDFSVSFVNLKLFSCLRAFSSLSPLLAPLSEYLHYQIYYYNISNGSCMCDSSSSPKAVD
jgi:hypothetical protein